MNKSQEKSSQEFRLKQIEKTRNYLTKDIGQNELIAKKHKKVCTTLNYIEHFLFLAFLVTGCISLSAFVSLLDIPLEITSSAIRLKNCAITAGIKKYKPTIKKKKKKHENIVWLEITKLYSIEVLVSTNLIDFFSSINMSYTLKRKFNKCSSPFDIYLTKWEKNEKYEFYIY